MAIIRHVPDAEEGMKNKERMVGLEARQLVLNATDEYGVEAAVRLRENGADAEIIVLGAGPQKIEQALRDALAMGADWAIHVETDCVLDSVALGQVAAQIACTEQVAIIFCGGQQSPSDSDALGAATAEWLQWPQTSWKSVVELKGNVLIGRHDVDNCSELFELPLPAVITAHPGLNEPRHRCLSSIMKPLRKEIRKEGLESFGATVRTKGNGVEIQTGYRRGKVQNGKDAPTGAHQLV